MTFKNNNNKRRALFSHFGTLLICSTEQPCHVHTCMYIIMKNNHDAYYFFFFKSSFMPKDEYDKYAHTHTHTTQP